MINTVKKQVNSVFLHLHTELTPGYCLSKYENVAVDTLVFILFGLFSYACLYVLGGIFSQLGFDSPLNLGYRVLTAPSYVVSLR